MKGNRMVQSKGIKKKPLMTRAMIVELKKAKKRAIKSK